MFFFFFFQAEDGIRDVAVTGVQTCALPILFHRARPGAAVLHRAVLDARLRRVHARRGDAAVAAADLEWRSLPEIPPRAVERRSAELLCELRPALEPVRRVVCS